MIKLIEHDFITQAISLRSLMKEGLSRTQGHALGTARAGESAVVLENSTTEDGNTKGFARNCK